MKEGKMGSFVCCSLFTYPPMAADFKLEQLSENIWSVTEFDDRNYHPINYIVVGTEKVLLIDTGCGFSNIYLYVKKLECVGDKPIIVVNTHNHPEQTGGNWRFSTTGRHGLSQRIEDLCASGKYKYYTRLMNSTHHWEVKTYKVTRWLDDNEFIFLGQEEEARNRIQIFWTPGHTPDSLCVWYAYGRRIFIGDLFQRYEDIKLTSEYADVKQTEGSVRRILEFVKPKREEGIHYSACHSENNGSCWPVFKHFHRFLLSVLAGTHPGQELRIDDEDGFRYESRDHSMKIVLSGTIVQQLLDARGKLHDF